MEPGPADNLMGEVKGLAARPHSMNNVGNFGTAGIPAGSTRSWHSEKYLKDSGTSQHTRRSGFVFGPDRGSLSN